VTYNADVFASLQSQHADFGVIKGTNGPIYYDSNYFWQSSLKMVMATMIHEFSHTNGKLARQL
jgi:hypothetical protein